MRIRGALSKGPCDLIAGIILIVLWNLPAQGQSTAGASKHYFLPASAENVQWGWYDPTEKPKLTVHSGDTVSIETLAHSLGQIKPGVGMDEIMKLRRENPGGGPHSITGPIYVEEAEPGDTLEIHFLKIVPKADGFNFNLPGRDFPTVGLLASEFPEGFVRYYQLNLVRMETEFKPGIVIDLKPFPGTFAVGVDPNEPDAKVSTASRRRAGFSHPLNCAAPIDGVSTDSASASL